MASPRDRGYGVRTVTLLLILAGPGACAALRIPPPPEGWTREDLSLSRATRSTNSQRLRFATAAGPLELRGTIRQYSPQEIPGWERPLAERAGSAIGGFVARQVGLGTNEVVVGHGALVISGPAAGEWELRCAVFWMIDQDIEYDRSINEDHVAEGSQRTRGMDCHGARATQPGVTVWRLNYGIAPPLDSIAAVYDSLAAEASPAVAAYPPIALVRLAADGEVEARYDVQRDQRSLRFGGADDRPLAVLHYGVDFAPAASSEEKVILRMIFVALTESWGL